jgi:Putative zinc-finger
MMVDRGIHEEHQRIADLIPWYVNGTIGEIDRVKVDSHLLTCRACCEDLSLARRIYEGMAAQPGLEYMPATSLKRLHAALDGLGAEAAAAARPVERRRPRRSTFRSWRGLAAACIALAAVTVALVGTQRWIEFRVRELPSNYHTVTSPAPHAPDQVIRAVFSPTITLVDLQGILDEAQLRIISGPTEAGVYSLAATSQRSVSSSLELLRAHRDVRFAESTQLDVQSGALVAHPRESP